MIASLGTGVLLGLSSGFLPGPLLTLMVAQTLRHGPREGVKVALSPLVTDVPIITLCLLVLAGLAHNDRLLGGLSLVGALVVALLGLNALRARPPRLDAPPAAPRSLLKGAAINALNPHPYLFWLTVGGPALLVGWGQSPATAGLFMGGFFVCLIGAQLAVVVLTASSRRFLGGRAHRALLRGLGALLLVFAATLARDGLTLLGVLHP
ncbi:MAG: LysE family translocator [Desulfovibrionaceae bacterium]